MKFGYRIIAFLAVFFTIMAVAATPAQASVTRCEPAPRMCVFDQENFLGNMYYWSPIPAVGNCYPLGTAPNGINWNDRVKSIRMNANIPVRFYKNTGCGGAHVTEQLVGTGSGGWEHCLDTWGKWYPTASPCNAPSASSFWIFWA